MCHVTLPICVRKGIRLEDYHIVLISCNFAHCVDYIDAYECKITLYFIRTMKKCADVSDKCVSQMNNNGIGGIEIRTLYSSGFGGGLEGAKVCRRVCALGARLFIQYS